MLVYSEAPSQDGIPDKIDIYSLALSTVMFIFLMNWNLLMIILIYIGEW